MTIRFRRTPLAALICSLGMSVAQAMTLTVVNTNDSGAGSLREAIASAPNNAEIAFAAGLTGTVTLASSLSITDKSLVIIGPGVDALIISGADTYRIFDVNSTTETNSLTLSGLTLAHGRSGSVAGSCGGISGYGGAICARNVNLTVTDAVFGQNAAEFGGGAIAAFDYDYSATRKPNPVVIRRCFFSSNQVTAAVAQGGGGAVMVYGFTGPTSATIDRSEFLDNSSAGTGGALTLYSAAATVSDTTFINSTAAAEGGAISVANWGTYVAGLIGLTVVNGTFNNNQGTYGGAIYSRSQDLSISSSTLYFNHAMVDDGGHALYATAAADANSSAIIHNTVLAGLPGRDAVFFSVVPTVSYSLIQHPSGIPAASLSDTITDVDPQIGGLIANGTVLSALNPRGMFSYLPPANSLVVNAGDPSSAGLPGYDQRGVGYARVQGGRVNIGAIETSYTVAVPGAPGLTRMVPGNHSMKLYFNPSVSDGGAAIDHYTATCVHGGASFPQTGTSSPITVGGLTKGVSYSCTVRAHNGIGDSAPSTASIKVARALSLVPVLSTVLE